MNKKYFMINLIIGEFDFQEEEESNFVAMRHCSEEDIKNEVDFLNSKFVNFEEKSLDSNTWKLFSYHEVFIGNVGEFDHRFFHRMKDKNLNKLALKNFIIHLKNQGEIPYEKKINLIKVKFEDDFKENEVLELIQELEDKVRL